MIRMSSVLSVLLVAGSAAAMGQDSPRQLRYRFEAGQILDFEMIQQTTVTSTLQEQRTEASVRNQSLRRWKVLEVDAKGVATIELTTLRVQMRSNEGSKVIEYDSADPKKQPETFKGLKDVIGKPISIVQIAPTGALLGEKTLIKAEGVAQMPAGQILPLLAEQPIAPGATWRRDFEVRLPAPAGRFPARQSFTLSGIEGGKAIITFKTAILAPIDNPALKTQLIQHQPAGKIEFDLERGLVVGQTQLLDKEVVGFAGPASSFKIKSTATERLVDISVAQAPDAKKTSQ